MDATVAPSDSAEVLFKKRGPKKSTIRKRAITPPPEQDSDNDASEYSTDDEGQRVKRRKKASGVTVISSRAERMTDHSASKFTADRSKEIAASDDATKQSNWYDDPSNLTNKELLGTTRTLSVPKTNVSYDASILEKKNEKTAARAAKGPVKAPTNIRTITVTDYSPDVCKDYKQTGFCGYGDGCVFLHSREDYKQGWQLDREWEEVTKGKKNLGGTITSSRSQGKVDEDDSDDEARLEGIPFACIICKESYKNPIVTRCGHYFCEACALNRFKKTPSCAQCSTGTGGVFNSAKNLKKLLAKKRERAARLKEQARENGEEVSEDEDDPAD